MFEMIKYGQKWDRQHQYWWDKLPHVPLITNHIQYIELWDNMVRLLILELVGVPTYNHMAWSHNDDDPRYPILPCGPGRKTIDHTHDAV